MKLDTSYLSKCIAALEQALTLLKAAPKESVEYELYRSACVKEFEIILEQSGKLLKKSLKPYFSSSKEVDKLYFKDVFRHAALHGIISLEDANHWIVYRDNRNSTAHDYGVGFANETLNLLPEFITKSKSLIHNLEQEIEKNDTST